MNSAGVDQHERRPAIHAEPVPERHPRIVDHRMLDPVFGDLAADVLGIALGVELAGMDTDDHELILIFFFELGQVRQDVMAIDAAKRPEIEQDDLAAQLGERDRAAS